MAHLLELILALTGVMLLVGLVVNFSNRDSVMADRMRVLTAGLSKVSAIVLALYVIVILYDLTGGALGFIQIGVYVACASIIIASWRDLMSSSELARNLATITAHRANQAHSDLSRRAAELNQNAANARTPKVPGEITSVRIDRDT